MSESEPKAEIVLPADAVYLIFFDDRDCPPQIIVGGAAARHRFKEVSISWNAHLFGKIESNCRDDKYHANNIQLAASPQVPLTTQEWLTKDEVDAVIRALSPDHDGSDFEAECPACTAYRKLAGRLVASHPAEMMDAEVQKSETAHPLVGLPCKDLPPALSDLRARCDVAVACLPDAPYRTGLRRLLDDLLASPVFGIIDPDYARVFTQARIVAWQYGYACVMHGSFTRDLDLLLTPWEDRARPNHDQLAKLIADACGLHFRDGVQPIYKATVDWTDRPHGRKSTSLFFPAPADGRWVDISVTPCIAASEAVSGSAIPNEGSQAALSEDTRRDLAELNFYRRWGYPYTDHSTMCAKDHQGLCAITLPLSLPSPQSEGTCAAIVIRAFTIPQLYQKAVEHVAAIEAEYVQRYGSLPLGESAEAWPSNEKAPESGGATAMEVLTELVLLCDGHYFTLPTFNPAHAAAWDRAKALVSAAQEGATR